MSSRIYIITPTRSTGSSLLVRAANRSQALSYIARTQYAVSVAKQDELVELVRSGTLVFDATVGENTAEESDAIDREARQDSKGFEV